MRPGLEPLAGLPGWAAIPAALLLLLGAGLALAGSFGLLRFRSFYERLHAPTIATSMGMGCVLLASMLVFSALQARLVIHELLIGVLMLVTTPVTLMLVARAAMQRDRVEGRLDVPLSARPPAVGADAASADQPGPDTGPGLDGPGLRPPPPPDPA
ncbi:monovalent cation/H(+) antiporter subunit G [Pseudoroseomonas cervicalis]|uniref:monovalent cation/H(+) antiporter subunit G n=1 Tax=Teichococcus cervicalis TaxID=204525 RepID=UPI0027814D61|nr:monovalent cation/H(+) antiporter subunit G [Pseudoroseomonas cervicalis]MDQ1077809.1 multicomponent K+:H+ antiporter subunit G [Pseudoroseomonas cervicalis]